MKVSASSRQDGVALVLVLAFLVLVTIIVTAFFLSVSAQVSLTDSVASSAATDQLADSAVNVVMAQIVDATKGSITGSSTFLSWASQPGMIRTYDALGAARTFYKLYSSENMAADPTDFTTKGEVIDPNWQTDGRDIYTDLNAPVRDASGTLVYPILDPAADGKTPGTTVATGGVDGFSITTPPGYDSSKDEGLGNNRAPMPVKWLYQLKDGTLVAASASTGSSGSSAKSVSVTGATVDNPIVGRIAFWTDDETSKINVNTASEGTYWDMPRVWSNEDFGKLSSPSTLATGGQGYAVSQPANHEYQRYPGHPATTCLSPVLGPLAGLTVPYPFVPTATTAGDSLEPYYNIAPRVGLPTQAGGGGSKGGTTLYPNLNSGLVVDGDRLYATVDELMFAAVKQTAANAPRIANTSSSPTPKAITRSVLERSRFFLTANSTAPEVTLYNTPRVSIWPVWTAASGKRTPYEKLSAFCATVKPSTTTAVDAGAYFFTRNNPRSQTEDFSARNRQLYLYLQKMTGTAIPGFGGTFQGKYPAADSIVASTLDSAVRATDCDQVLTEIYDYIRCTSLQDKTASNSSYTPIHVYPTNPSNTPIPGSPVPGAGEVLPILNPVNGTQGFGRTYSISQAALHFCCTQETYTPATAAKAAIVIPTAFRAYFTVVPSSPPQGLSPLRSNLKFTVRNLSNLQVNFIGSSAVPVSLLLPPSGTNFVDESDMDVHHGRAIGGSEQPHFLLLSANRSVSSPTWNNKLFDIAGEASHDHYPFFSSDDILIPANATVQATSNYRFFQLSLKDPSKLVEIDIADATNGTVIQSLRLRIPPADSSNGGKFRVPRMKARTFASAVVTPVITGPLGTREIWNTSTEIVNGPADYDPPYQENNPAADPDSIVITPPGLVSTRYAYGDTVVSMEVAGVPDTANDLSPARGNDTDRSNLTSGDFRMISGLHFVPSTRFRANDNWLNANPEGTAYAHSLELDIGQPVHGGHYGNLIDFGITWADKTSPPRQYGSIRQPAVPSRARNGVKNYANLPGDWDTGIGDQKDGAHINRPDEGDTAFTEMEGSSANVREPYYLGFRGGGTVGGTNGYFSPTRMVPSPMMFGSLPTGVLRMRPWQTLSFSPHPENAHPGNLAPKDHLLADLFWMPVVEPWAISQPFATAGKINLNYQIQPFTYIKRQTGIYAALKAVKFAALSPDYAKTYKPLDAPNSTVARVLDIRRNIDLATTADVVGMRFQTNDLYRSATEICEVNLIPLNDTKDPITLTRGPFNPFASQNVITANEVATKMGDYWRRVYPLTGDNLREKPYVDLYPRLTTKSNTFTVHVRAQTLKKSRNTPVDQWVAGVDTVAGEYRGSTILERYIDVNAALPDFAVGFTGVASTSPNLDSYYKMRVVANKRFSP